ncbi:GNAT family N-acetyltransferase [Granulicella sp. S190]|uniref:GNAT family N-acetyltransferase n=1 Tax=Granulicella sp. S190 TaxID=1747226 RepID=UPI00131BB19F|nr:GNAT family N-acetyltransferase [Granulicella sp. S190]
MTDLPESLFANPVWSALHTKHRRFSVCAGEACRYPADVTPFVAVSSASAEALVQLHSLLVPGESVWIVGESFPQVPELVFERKLEVLQMVLPAEVAVPEAKVEIVPLPNEEAPDMVALTDIAFPGFFRSRTCEMGSYFGIRAGGQLIAMGGERLTLDGYPEVSGICTHPDYRGRGYAESLIWHLARMHRQQGVISWLHVSATNDRAIELYRRMGFVEVRRVMLHRITCSD